MRKTICILIIGLVLLSAFIVPTNAGSLSENGFSDLDKNHWAYESAKVMVDSGIMKKDSKGRFNPAGKVSRGEFAKLIVKALDLTLRTPEEGTFIDIPQDTPLYAYVETAKYYLTGYRTSQGDYFRPEEYSVREDIAVALVKAMGYQPTGNFMEILGDYEDLDEISPNLRSFVATVVDHKIMIGTGSNGKKIFSPQFILTRAEVAKLLYNILNMQKVTYEEGDKVTYELEETVPTPTPILEEDDGSYIPSISIDVVSEGLKVLWNRTKDDDFHYYKVVMSKTNPYPSYPDDGYIVCISDNEDTDYVIQSGKGYTGGDFSKVLSGQKYHISVTAVYDHGKYTSNVIYMEMP